jgi:hypothetical protein
MVMAYPWAVPGAKCVCIKSAWAPRAFNGEPIPDNAPQVGDVLTIRKVIDEPTVSGGAALSFKEQRPQDWFAIAGFRPLVTHSQEHDVALFTPILHGQPVGA